MHFENIDTGVILDSDMPWTPYIPYSDTVMVKLFKANPVTGEMVIMLKAPIGTALPIHRHSGTVIVYTVKGAWRYVEHDWVATPGSVVYETAGSSHTPVMVEGHGDEVIALNIVVGDLIYFDETGTNVLAIENWRTAVQRYLDYCAANGIAPKDVTAFSG